MILGQVSWLDCFIFILFLAPQLIYHVGFFTTLIHGLRSLPFLLIKLPLGLIKDRILTGRARRNRFVQQATWFEDTVVRCVRYAFAFIPARIGRVFFSKMVALPFLRFRMLRHGYFKAPIHWQEIKMSTFQGLWISEGINADPDIIIFYVHGGGFSMGSSYFYLEFLIALLVHLKLAGYKSPAIFTLEYTLVPDAAYPTQLHQALSAYKNLTINHDPARIVVSGDSAGGTLILSMLLHIARQPEAKDSNKWRILPPAMAVLISPWVTLVSPQDKNTNADYLDAANLHLYAKQYAGSKIAVHDPLISPGDCKDLAWWQAASPSEAFFVCWGAEEVFAPEIRGWVDLMRKGKVEVEECEERGGIHAWPVVAVFLSSTEEERLKGLKMIVGRIRERIGS